ncbi:phenylacetate-CoA oxygenase/reductase subunit PaaK [Nibrella saemangeumensis]|uniref:Phenylacetate-CoA oxygenase/reductase subunit PaaK n=1 Tax=Nibrella saemangeumensis TaxID=1084526 RepID=A0ABP8MCY9_9BACT
MNQDFLPLRVIEIIPETPDAKSFRLEPVDGSTPPYRAGQFLTFILNRAGHEVRRSYSLSSAPGVDPYWQVTIKRVANGEISRYLLNHLYVGDVLTTLPPAGRFTIATDPALRRDIILLGAGSGISPLFGLLKQVLREEPQSYITLLYSNTRESSIIFNQELKELQQQYPERFRLWNLLSQPSDHWTGMRGRLNNTRLEQLLPDLIQIDRHTCLFYVCGPFDYMRMVQFTFLFSGFRPEQIRRENFVIEPVTLAPPPALSRDHQILLRYRGQEYAIDVPAYKNILQAALNHGLTLPYSCRGGRCSSCAARCRSGRVYMTINDVLTERDLADGWVLTCTGYPESEGVFIDV